jgi:short subunit dehydrogenase-like uncharacterized protein
MKKSPYWDIWFAGRGKGGDVEREMDIVLWGATGFTGQLVAERLMEMQAAGTGIRWGLGGRNRTGLERLRARLAERHPAAVALPIVVGDSMDQGSLNRIAAQAKVVCSTVGPYARYGSGMVEACVEEGSHYCDLTGEAPWIREMIDRHHKEAERKELRLVHCCGYDSIPSDLGTYILQEEAIQRYGKPFSEIRLYVGSTKGGVSGGTVASMLEILGQSGSRRIQEILMDPYSLNPEGEREGLDRGDQMWAGYDREDGRWTAPFVMAGINTRVVRRSNALLGYRYGREFRYSETMAMPGGMRGWLMAQLVSGGISAFVLAGVFPPMRWMAEKLFLPAPGEGPERTKREAGHFKIRLEGDPGGERSLRARVEGDQDPGYGSTSLMLAHAAASLAQDQADLPERFGCLTPASAMGSCLAGRLRGAGMTLSVEG